VQASSAADPEKRETGPGTVPAGSPGPAAETRKPSERRAVLQQLFIIASNALLVGTAGISMM